MPATRPSKQTPQPHARLLGSSPVGIKDEQFLSGIPPHAAASMPWPQVGLLTAVSPAFVSFPDF